MTVQVIKWGIELFPIELDDWLSSWLNDWLIPVVIVLDEKPPGPAPPILDWPTVNKQMPWSVIILLGGGFALADACKVSTYFNNSFIYLFSSCTRMTRLPVGCGTRVVM